ncbi:hypothetical protein DCE79_11090 [Lysinibacillus sp. 2017]|nr:hypothetical protein DCE79_11090 [Lysinibacillus sp. 2017]TGN33155.1 hypothetical protein E4L99_15045 [Lysinibacillus sp. S2017]
MNNVNTVAIHSPKAAGLIVKRGQTELKTEPNRNRPDRLVFIFEQSDLVSEVLNEVRRCGRPQPLYTSAK